MSDDPNKREFTDEELQDLVASSDTGARDPGGSVAMLIAGTALAWAFFQIWIASPFQTVLPGFILNGTRNVHLGFAIFLAFMAYPAFKNSPRNHIPITDWILALVGAFCALYGALFYAQLVERPGLPTTMDLAAAGVGLVILLEAARRALGPALAIVAMVFLSYVFFGSSELVPDVIRWKGASFNKAMSHMWITSEGVFGIALGVSTKFVFLFVLFGSLLDRAGAGGYFIKMAFGSLGHLRGGPAKAAVIGSAATGLISGSSIANVVTTGTFTIPLMKRVGFSAEKAGSVEVASSVNGQIMPPVMGAAAFLMVEYVGISYVEVIKAAFLPAIISYIALVYLVHLEALKEDMEALPKPGGGETSILKTIAGMFGGFIVFGGICYGVSYPVGWIAGAAGPAAGWIIAALVFATYVALLKLAAKVDDLEEDDPNAEIVALPDVGEIWRAGVYFLLPIIVLVYFLMIERKSPGLSAFWATMFLVAILLTQKPLKAMFRGSSDFAAQFKEGFSDLIQGMIAGARNMIGIGIATATAGVIVGTVSLTGIGQVMAAFVEFVSAGNLILMLVFVGILSLILGMGLPTTANYIVVSSLMAGVIVELGAQSGLIVPLIAVHLFVFYFGIMADVTPPVGLASFAAAAVSGGDPIKTGFIAFFYSLRTVALPFLFIFNTDLLLIDVGWAKGIFVFCIATVAILLFAAGTQGYFFARSRWYESITLVVVSFMLFRPGFFQDYVQPPFNETPLAAISETYAAAPDGSDMRVVVTGPDFDVADKIKSTTVLVKVAEGDSLDSHGIVVNEDGGQFVMDEPFPGTTAGRLSDSFDFYGDTPVTVSAVKTPAERMPKEVFYIPALILLALVILLQRRRQTKPAF